MEEAGRIKVKLHVLLITLLVAFALVAGCLDVYVDPADATDGEYRGFLAEGDPAVGVTIVEEDSYIELRLSDTDSNSPEAVALFWGHVNAYGFTFKTDRSPHRYDVEEFALDDDWISGEVPLEGIRVESEGYFEDEDTVFLKLKRFGTLNLYRLVDEEEIPSDTGDSEYHGDP